MKKLEMTKSMYDEIKQITKTMTCFADGEKKIIEKFDFTRATAYEVLSAVYHDYKYLKVI